MEYSPKDIPLIGYKKVDEELRLRQILCDLSLANSVAGKDDNFEVIWSSLSRRIPIKWADRLKNRLAKGYVSSLQMQENEKVIFENITGSIKSGQLTAILGPSGAGKTTLLDCIVGRPRPGTSGRLQIRGGNPRKDLKVCTIPQKDFLPEQLTVEENLQYASRIKNSKDVSFEHANNVSRVVSMLQLESCLNVKISKISGGQHKRVSIAQELLSNPDILVLDEPTSGLDSMTCYKTVMALKNLILASQRNEIQPLSVVLTIHQPEIIVYELFDKAYVLASCGRPIYEGAPQDSMRVIRSVLPHLDLPNYRHYNPASLLIEIASNHYGIDAANTMADMKAAQFTGTILKYIDEDSASCQTNLQQDEDYCSNRSVCVDDPKSLVASISPSYTSRSVHTNEDIESNIDTTSFSSSSRKNDTNKKGNKSIICNAILGKSNGGTLSRPLLQDDDQLFADDINDFTYNLSSGSNNSGKIPTMHIDSRMIKRENQSPEFWKHTSILTERICTSTLRDVKLLATKLAFHIMIPIFMYTMYQTDTGSVNSCPYLIRSIDILELNDTSEKAEDTVDQTTITIENMTFFFIAIYGFSLCALALTTLSFPMNMHVLMKETRNGWYSTSSYILAKTIADTPADFGFPMLTSIAIYLLTAQATSTYNWRMIIVSLTITLCTMISQTQGLIFGALFMNNVETAIFLSQSMTVPAILVSGFVMRIERLPHILKMFSYTSIYRWGVEIIGVARYGFHLCPCDPKVFSKEIDYVGFPRRMRVYAYRALEGFKRYKERYNLAILKHKDLGTLDEYIDKQIPQTIDGDTFDTYFPDDGDHEEMENIFYDLADQLARAPNIGTEINSCDDVKPNIMHRFKYNEDQMFNMLAGLCILLLFMKLLMVVIVHWALKNN